MPYEKVGKNEPVCIADEVPFEIPESWEWVRISGIFSIINGDRGKNYPAKSTLSNTGIPFISAVNLNGETVIEDDNLLCLSDEQFNKLGSGKLEKDDVVVCIRGSLGKHGRYPFEKGAIASSLVILRPHLNIPLLSDFIMIYLDSPLFFSEIKRYDNGTAQPNLSAKSLEMFFVPLPPLSEQKRIVDKLNEVSSYTDSYLKTYVRSTELNQKFPDLLKKSILQEAIRGKLVPQDPSDEPASVLVERIRAEKERLIQEGKIKRDKHESIIYRRDNSHYEKRGSEEVCIDEELPFELPDNWEWVKLSDLAQFIGGYAYKSETFIEKSEYQVLRLGNVKNDEIRYSAKPVFISKELAEKTADFRCKPNDILLTMTGTRLKRDYFYTVAVSNKDTNCFVNQRVGCLREYYPNIYKWLIWVLKSEGILSQVFKHETGTANQGNLGAENIMKTFIPLPPLNEQNRICNMIECLLKKTSAL